MSVEASDLETLATAPASVSTDAGSFSERSADDVLKLRSAAAGQTAVTGTNPQGGPRSLWNRLRPSKVIPVDPT